MEVFMAAGAFVGLFTAFVVAPTMIQKRHEGRRDDADSAGPGIPAVGDR